MPNPRFETFALAMARGRTSIEAADEAGYSVPNKRAKELRERPDILKRIAVLRELRAGGGSGDLGDLIDRLIGLADKALEAADPKPALAARACLAEAAKLKRLLPADPPLARATRPAPARPRPMTQEEWLETYAPPARAG